MAAKSAGRVFEPISSDDLRGKVYLLGNDRGEFSLAMLIEKLGKDIKLQFDLENQNIGDDDSFGPEGLVGIVSLANGLTFWGMSGGGDWEHPVYFIVYWDGKKLRGYVPTGGNPWNTDTKQAYGNNAAADLKNAIKRWPGIQPRATSIEPDDFDFNPGAILNDILDRLKKK